MCGQRCIYKAIQCTLFMILRTFNEKFLAGENIKWGSSKIMPPSKKNGIHLYLLCPLYIQRNNQKSRLHSSMDND